MEKFLYFSLGFTWFFSCVVGLVYVVHGAASAPDALKFLVSSNATKAFAYGWTVSLIIYLIFCGIVLLPISIGLNTP